MPSQLCLAHDATSVAREHSGSQLQGPSRPAGQCPLSQDSSYSGPSGPFLRNLGLPCAPTRVQTGSQSSQCLGHSHFRLDPETPYWLYLHHEWTTGTTPLGIWAVGPRAGRPALLITAGRSGVSIRSPQVTARPSGPASFSNRGGTLSPLCLSPCLVLGSAQVTSWTPRHPSWPPEGPWN